MVMQSTPLWLPSAERKQRSQIYAFIDYCNTHYKLGIDKYREDTYQQLHTWSVTRREQFWEAVWSFHHVTGTYGNVALETSLAQNQAVFDSAQWFPGSRLNFAENLLSDADDTTALIERGEDGRRRQFSYAELKQLVTQLSAYMRDQGIQKGDRVAAFLPNSHYAVVGMLAAASIGAIWSSCSPDFGVQGVLDRFDQIQPKLLIACDGYQYAGKQISTLERVAGIARQIDSLEVIIIAPYLESSASHQPAQSTDLPLSESSDAASVVTWTKILSDYDQRDRPIVYEQLPFDSPLYILYSSGTTGVPKCIVHSVGGTLLQHLKELALHSDVSKGSTLFYYTTCGWMMWNWLVSGLALGATLVLYDGSPFHPQQTILFDIADEEQIEIFGASAKYYAACEKFGLAPKHSHTLEFLRTMLSTGSPLAHESFDYIYTSIKQDLCLSSISGGTDIVSCFALGNPILPVFRGTLQCAGLGMDLAFYDDDGKALVTGRGELVCQQPFPSAPIGFWNDDGTKYKKAYFSRFSGIWAHGDYGEYLPLACAKHNDPAVYSTVVIHGRSDAVLNPGGVRIGTAELYRQVEKVDQVFEAMAVGQTWNDDVRIILFVRLKDGLTLDDALIEDIKRVIRSNTTPRHVPAKIIQVDDLPRTLSGKIVELAVKKIIHGETVSNQDALANPEALEQFKHIPALSEA